MAWLTAGVRSWWGSLRGDRAASVLARVGPSYGLYASFAGRIGGGLFTSTRRGRPTRRREGSER